ncbi:MAG TPA: GNAT family N-acetyltransferase [Streptomyces sp.]|nr:GNAT family N-acetyltransferase [Streptomyces sp.]
MSRGSPFSAALRPLDEELLGALLTTAVAHAAPREVMPPAEDLDEDGAGGGGAGGDTGPAGWTAAHREAFLRFHRSHSPCTGSAEAPHGRGGETTYAVVVREAGRPGETVAGAARLAPCREPGGVEAGLWLGRPYRGRGVGTAVLAQLLDMARAGGAARLSAVTSAANTAARRLLTAAGADLVLQDDGTVTARVPLG